MFTVAYLRYIKRQKEGREKKGGRERERRMVIGNSDLKTAKRIQRSHFPRKSLYINCLIQIKIQLLCHSFNDFSSRT